MNIDVTAILQKLLAESPTERNFDQILAHVCLKQYGAKWESVLNSVRQSMDDHAKAMKISPLEAARQLAFGESATMLSAKAEGKTESVDSHEDSQTYRATEEMDIESQRVAMALMQARLQSDGLSSSQLHDSVPGVGLWKYAIMLFLAVVLVGAPMILKQYLDSKAGQRRGMATNLNDAIAMLEKRHAETPDDVEISLRLSHSRVEKLLAAQAISSLRTMRTQALARKQTGGRIKDDNISILQITRQLGVTPNPTDMANTLKAAKSLLKKLYRRKDLSRKQQLTALTLYGHVLVLEGKTAEAGQCLNKASTLSTSDPRLSLLRAAKREAEKKYDRAYTATFIALNILEEWAKQHPAELSYVPWSHSAILPSALDKQKAALLMQINIHIGLQLRGRILKLKANRQAGIELGDVPKP